jgi:hypothetical protein
MMMVMMVVIVQQWRWLYHVDEGMPMVMIE